MAASIAVVELPPRDSYIYIHTVAAQRLLEEVRVRVRVRVRARGRARARARTRVRG